MTDTPITENGMRAALERALTKRARQSAALAATNAEISLWTEKLTPTKKPR